MIKARLLFFVVMVNCIAAKAQLLPAALQKLPLKQNQIAKRWSEGISECASCNRAASLFARQAFGKC